MLLSMTDRRPFERFSVTLLVRRTLRKRASRRHALLVESLMEEFARGLPLKLQCWCPTQGWRGGQRPPRRTPTRW
jgi:hypothetical protein